MGWKLQIVATGHCTEPEVLIAVVFLELVCRGWKGSTVRGIAKVGRKSLRRVYTGV